MVDLLGEDGEVGLPADYELHGFASVGAGASSTSAADLATYELAAWQVAVALLPDADARDRLLGCEVISGPLDLGESVEGAVQHGCLRPWLVRLLSRAWRRPVRSEEIASVTGLFVELTAAADATLAARAVLVTALLAPDFLYIVEHGAPQERLSSHELAVRLSFFLTNGPPDEALRAAAASGELLEDAELERQALRLMESSAGESALRAWFGELVNMDQLALAEKDPELYPDDSAALRAAMSLELEALWTEAASRGLPLLLTSERATVDASLAELYGVTMTAPSSRVVRLNEPSRGGLLGRAGFATIYGTASRGSPTARGRFVRERLLCEPVSAPPADLDLAGALEAVPAESTFRTQLEAATADASCQGCHEQVDPIGFGLENMDGLGRWRTEEAGRPVDASGELDGVAFDGPADLGSLVADDPRFLVCLDEQLRRHALGHQTDGVGGAQHLEDLVLQLVLSEAFRTRGLRPGEAC